ncbi:hypothetical protein MY8738_005056 [Beauveria namnaoensis]
MTFSAKPIVWNKIIGPAAHSPDPAVRSAEELGTSADGTQHPQLLSYAWTPWI